MRTNSMGPPHKPDTAACVGRGGAAERVNFRVRTEMNDAKLAPTMGSLFDGIGGFPLAAIHNGIVPVWASEIEAFPIEVTRLRFPDMVHVGDITKLDGAELPPVDIICGGSPCQDLSVAGNRAGLSGARSGLFMEQVRLVKEMRNADEQRGRAGHAVRPRYMLWENVPGAFSSGTPKGEDFRIVLEEIVRIKVGGVSVPRPDTGRWESAGAAILGDQFSLAWRVLDAQYWGVAQRRRRIFLVADFGGLTAPKILFEQERLLGDPAEGQGQGKGVTTTAGNSSADSGGSRVAEEKQVDIFAFHINQREETINLNGISGALMATTNMQMQTFVTQPDEAVEGFDGYNGDLTGDVAATLGVNCGMSTGRNGVMAFAANQRDEVRDLHDVAGALGAQPGMKQQTFVAEGVVTKGNGDCFLSEERHTALSAGGGQAGQGYPCVLTAAFSAGAGASAGGIGYGEELSPTLKGSAGGNCMPSVLCLNDQGGSVMEYSENVSGTLRAQEHGHQPLVYENHGIDSRYTGPHKVAPTMSARYGTGGNNVPLVEQDSNAICIAGNIVDRQPQNGGNGLGCQDDLAYTLTATDRHAVFSRQRVDAFRQNNVASTQSARQYKDATDLICQQAEVYAYLIRRLTPLECERLQGFPDGWTDIPDASDSARYKALGNSVAIPCVEFIISRIAAMLRAA